MKYIALLFLIAFAVCDETHYFHHNGTMVLNKETGPVFGVTIVEILKTINMTYLAGMYVKNKVHTPFELVGKFTSYKKNSDGSFEIAMTYISGKVNNKNIQQLSGTATLKGNWNSATYKGKGADKKGQFIFEITADEKKAQCEFYPMKDAAKRAGYLVGESSRVYRPANILNHAVYGYSYMKKTCMDYLKSVGSVIAKPMPGALIVGKDGKNCAIIDHEGDKFIHANPSTKKVSMSSMAVVANYFKAGYILKEYKCTKY